MLLLQEVGKPVLAVLAKVALELLLREGVQVLDVADVHVPRRARVHRELKCGRQGPSVLAPADLQSPAVQRRTMVRCDLEERQRCRR